MKLVLGGEAGRALAALTPLRREILARQLAGTFLRRSFATNRAVVPGAEVARVGGYLVEYVRAADSGDVRVLRLEPVVQGGVMTRRLRH